MSWVRGKQLATVCVDTGDYCDTSFRYDANGIRTEKRCEMRTAAYTSFYLTQNGKVLQERIDLDNACNILVLDFIYDESGRPFALNYSTDDGAEFTMYYYILNLQGDVVKLVTASGETVASYEYDAWGDVLSQSGEMASINPLRYRGYYYDVETGFYYLQSRYYDPANRRFINADNYLSTDIEETVACNMFAYCLNNPVNYSDYTGSEAVIISIIIGSLLEALGTLLAIVGVTTVVLLILGGIHEISKAIKSAADDEPKEKPAVSPEGEAIAAPPETPQGGNNNNKNKKNGRKQNEKNYKKINGNKMARQLAQKFGFESAEALKEGYVRKESVSKFNMAINMNTFELVLISLKDSNIIIPTGIYMK